MKTVLRSLVLLMVVFGLGGYVYYLGTGSVPFSGFSLKQNHNERPDLRRLSEMPSLNSVEEEDTAKPEIRKWQDEEGAWHFSNRPDKEGEG